MRSNIDFIFEKNNNPTIILAGDFNNLNTDFIESELGLSQIVLSPTHGDNLLDKVFVNRPDIFKTSVVKSLIKTKHSAVFISALMSNESCVVKNGRKKITFPDLRQHNIDKLRYMTGTFDWSMLHNSDIQTLYDSFLYTLRGILDTAIPKITVTLGPRDPPYVTPLVKHLLNTRNKLIRKGKSAEAAVLAQKNNEIITSIRVHSLNKLEDATAKELWAAVNPKPKALSTENSFLNNVDSVNTYFSKISFDTNSCIDNVNCQASGYDMADVDSSVYNSFNCYSVEKLLSSLCVTSSGLDDIPYWVFKNCSYELSDIIAYIFTLSLYSGCVPYQWRKAVVTPIPKIPKPSSLSDYRPISVTPILSRILEKVVVKLYLRPAIDKGMSGDQFAFRPTGSTTSSLVYLMHHVTSMLQDNAYVRCLLIDFSKAFDVIDHNILITKLAKLSIPSYVYKWVTYFLLQRTQVVKFNGCLSSPCPINRGVVQRSGVGPTLFSIMVDDLKTISKLNKLFKYADDTNLLIPEKTDVDLGEEFLSYISVGSCK